MFSSLFFREFEDNASLDGSLENMERGSIASFGSGNTTDSDHHTIQNDLKVSFRSKTNMNIELYKNIESKAPE